MNTKDQSVLQYVSASPKPRFISKWVLASLVLFALFMVFEVIFIRRSAITAASLHTMSALICAALLFGVIGTVVQFKHKYMLITRIFTLLLLLVYCLFIFQCLTFYLFWMRLQLN